MGATTGNRGNMDAARRQQASMDFQATRRRAMEQQGQGMDAARRQQASMAFEEERNRAMQQQGQGAVPEMSAPAPQEPRGRAVGRGRMPEMRSGINFGPGRANRIPEQGSPEYEQLLQRVRGLNQGR